MFLISGANSDEWLHTNWQIAAVNQKLCISVSSSDIIGSACTLFPLPQEREGILQVLLHVSSLLPWL